MKESVTARSLPFLFNQRVWAIGQNTFLELVRQKVFYFLLLFGFLVIGSSLFTVELSFQNPLQVLKDVGLGAMSVFSWLLGLLCTAMLLPKDMEDRTLYTILAKPVPRFEYLTGKLLGVFFLLALALFLMGGLFAGNGFNLCEGGVVRHLDPAAVDVRHIQRVHGAHLGHGVPDRTRSGRCAGLLAAGSRGLGCCAGGCCFGGPFLSGSPVV